MNLQYKISHLIGMAVKICLVLIFLFPFYWLIITSVKTVAETYRFPPTYWPKEISFKGYITLFSKMHLLKYAKNSVIVTFSVLILQTIVLIPTAYIFAKKEFFGKNILFGLILVAFMIPQQVTFITVYLTMSKWNLLSTLLPQILPFVTNAFGIFLLRQSFKQIPEEILEVARMDNASEQKIVMRIMVPMCKSTLVVISLFSFISNWNSYFWPLVMTNIDSIRPLTIAIAKLKTVEEGINWNLIMAGNVLLILPILIIYFFANQKIMESLGYRGVK